MRSIRLHISTKEIGALQLLNIMSFLLLVIEFELASKPKTWVLAFGIQNTHMTCHECTDHLLLKKYSYKLSMNALKE